MDIRLRQLASYGFDITFRAGDFLPEQGLETAVLISLFTDRRVENEELPPFESEARGWWGDLFSGIEGDETGSKLWLLNREVITQDAINRAQEYAEQSLQWLVDDGIAESVNVEASVFGREGYLLDITIKKPNTNEASNYRYQVTWDGQFAQQAADEPAAVPVPVPTPDVPEGLYFGFDGGTGIGGFDVGEFFT